MPQSPHPLQATWVSLCIPCGRCGMLQLQRYLCPPPRPRGCTPGCPREGSIARPALRGSTHLPCPSYSPLQVSLLRRIFMFLLSCFSRWPFRSFRVFWLCTNNCLSQLMAIFVFNMTNVGADVLPETLVYFIHSVSTPIFLSWRVFLDRTFAKGKAWKQPPICIHKYMWPTHVHFCRRRFLFVYLCTQIRVQYFWSFLTVFPSFPNICFWL